MSNSISDFCAQILKLNSGIRFAGIANNEGTLAGHAYRPGLVPLLTQQESEISVLQSLIRAGTRRSLEKKLGRALFSYTRYEKVKRVTVDIKTPSGGIYIFMISFDLNVEPEPVIIGKILPLLQELVL